MTQTQQPKHAMAEAVRLLALVILFFGLIGCAFYAKAHGVSPNWFWTGAIIVFIAGIWDML